MKKRPRRVFQPPPRCHPDPARAVCERGVRDLLFGPVPVMNLLNSPPGIFPSPVSHLNTKPPSRSFLPCLPRVSRGASKGTLPALSSREGSLDRRFRLLSESQIPIPIGKGQFSCHPEPARAFCDRLRDLLFAHRPMYPPPL